MDALAPPSPCPSAISAVSATSSVSQSSKPILIIASPTASFSKLSVPASSDTSRCSSRTTPDNTPRSLPSSVLSLQSNEENRHANQVQPSHCSFPSCLASPDHAPVHSSIGIRVHRDDQIDERVSTGSNGSSSSETIPQMADANPQPSLSHSPARSQTRSYRPARSKYDDKAALASNVHDTGSERHGPPSRAHTYAHAERPSSIFTASSGHPPFPISQPRTSRTEPPIPPSSPPVISSVPSRLSFFRDYTARRGELPRAETSANHSNSYILNSSATFADRDREQQEREWRRRQKGEGSAPPSPGPGGLEGKVNLYTECGRHSDDWLFGGFSFESTLKKILGKKTDKNT